MQALIASPTTSAAAAQNATRCAMQHQLSFQFCCLRPVATIQPLSTPHTYRLGETLTEQVSTRADEAGVLDIGAAAARTSFGSRWVSISKQDLWAHAWFN